MNEAELERVKLARDNQIESDGTKLNQTESFWFEMDPTGSTLIKSNQHGSKLIEVKQFDRNQSYWVEKNQSESEWITSNQNESSWIEISQMKSDGGMDGATKIDNTNEIHKSEKKDACPPPWRQGCSTAQQLQKKGEVIDLALQRLSVRKGHASQHVY